MRFARALLIFSYGLFTIAAQTLLFREFITTFEGNDISVGIFFSSWFVWVGLGALFIYRARLLAEKLLENLEFLFLAYLPAFVLELILIIQARQLAGVESYALLPIRTILLLSIVVNAPVSIITGVLFPLVCRWIQRDHELPVSRAYILEAAGSFFGGLGVTILLGIGVSSARIFLVLAFVVSSSTFAVQFARRLTEAATAKGRRETHLPAYNMRSFAACGFSFLLPLFVLVSLAFGADKALMDYVRIIKWTKLLPRHALGGSFQTPQAEYLYGTYQGQWVVVREGSVCEALPDETTAGRIAAIALCQNSAAQRVLVIGSGLGLCREFLRLPQIEHVTWAHCDTGYVRQLEKFIPPQFKIVDERFHTLAADVRSLLAEKQRYYDIVILNLPEATSSVLNRYYTLEFYHQVKGTLRAEGVFGLRIAGGENIMGTELISLGASTKLTLEKVFSRLVLTPGEDTWFIASDSGNLTGDPGTLRDRFAAIEGAPGIFPPNALLSVYLPDRAAAALENYSGSDLPEAVLVNRDSRPLTHLYSLLLAAKQSEAPVTKFAKHLILAGPLTFLVPILILLSLRVVYVLKATEQAGPSGFESSFLVFSAGFVGIGVVIVLMYLYQTRFGSLYLHIGVISSIFMVGLTAGAAFTRHLLISSTRPASAQNPQTETPKLRPEILLSAVLCLHTIVLAAIAFWPGQKQTHVTFAAAFALCGLCAGGYFPLAAGQLADIAFETGRAASKLETADHLGASAGGLLTALALVPLLGTKLTLLVFVLLMLANVPLAVLRTYKRQEICALAGPAFGLRRLGYILFGIGLCVVLCSDLLADAGAELMPSLPQSAARALAGSSQIEKVSTVSDSSRRISYFKTYEPEENDTNSPLLPSVSREPTGYIFSSEDLAPEVRSFGGKMNLAVYVDATGKLLDFHIIRSNDTPAYLELLSQWRELLSGRRLFLPRPFADVDAVTGATVSSEAVLSALEKSGRKFATQILGHSLGPDLEQMGRRASYVPAAQSIYLVSAFLLTLVVIYRGGFWSRLAVLLFNLLLGGLVFNAQYSTEQIATVLSLQAPAIGLSAAFLLVVGIPLLILTLGNVYCGYICPFGAAQELLGYVVPRRFRHPISIESMRNARFIKYAVLFGLIIVFFVSRNRTTLAADPLIEVFSFRFSSSGFRPAIMNLQSSTLLIVAAALIGSVLYTRFWCRYLCPVGAFLSLFNNVAILRRYTPAKKFGRCEFGLTPKDQMDCLYCDKCRYEAKTAPGKERVPQPHRAQKTLLSQSLVVAVLAVAALVSTVSVSRFLEVIPAGLEHPITSVASGGEPRDVDVRRIRTMIRQKKLSDQEAEYYKKLE